MARELLRQKCPCNGQVRGRARVIRVLSEIGSSLSSHVYGIVQELLGFLICVEILYAYTPRCVGGPSRDLSRNCGDAEVPQNYTPYSTKLEPCFPGDRFSIHFRLGQ